MELFGVKLLGLSEETLRKALLTVAFTIVILILRFLLGSLAHVFTRNRTRQRFWIRQALSMFSAVLLLLSLLSIWFDDPARLATGVGLLSAGLAFALQKVVTSLAGYFVIMRSRVFSIGDRITMGGVRGDVVMLGFLKTTIMEMGDPTEEPKTVWVHGRQHTGRIVTVTNDKIFEEPVFNSTRDFPYIWDEIRIPITYATDRELAERILLDAAEKATADTQKEAKSYTNRMHEVYPVEIGKLGPSVYYRITDNWLELTLRFLVSDRNSREIKDIVSRHILARFDEAKIGIASTTIDIVAFPTVRTDRAGQAASAKVDVATGKTGT
jgi:small-conductance mechanosensitive channel